MRREAGERVDEGDVEAALAHAAELILAAEPPVALACHVNPDGDALGSMLALHHVLRAAGIPSVASFSEPFVVAPHYRELPGLELLDPPDEFPREPERDGHVRFGSARAPRRPRARRRRPRTS